MTKSQELVLNESVWVKEEEGKERVVKALIRRRYRGGEGEQQERLLTDPQLFFGGRVELQLLGCRFRHQKKERLLRYLDRG